VFSFGAVAVLATPEGTEAMAAVKQATGWLGPILMVLFLLNIISHNALNLYGAVLSIVTSIQTFASQWTPSIKVRVVLSSVVLAACCVVALNASADFISQFIGLILALLLVLVPWASINLIDFYLIKRGSYDIASIFRADGGIYGRFNLRDHCLLHRHPGATAVRQYVAVCRAVRQSSLYVGPYANLVVAPPVVAVWSGGDGAAVLLPRYTRADPEARGEGFIPDRLRSSREIASAAP
jgi:NCS1 family nucleobase:cation symporter-1